MDTFMLPPPVDRKVCWKASSADEYEEISAETEEVLRPLRKA